MNIKPISILAACVFFTAGCNKSPTTPTADSNGSQPPPAPIQAEPFHGQVYKSIDGRNTLTLTSKDECELAQGGTTLLCKYTKQADALRIIATVMGTPQVIYYRFTDQGIQDNNGNVLLSPDKYTAAVEQLQRQQQEAAKAQMEKQRVEEELANSTIETKTISEFSLSPHVITQDNGKYTTDGKLIITDVSLKLHLVNHLTYYNQDENHDDIYFSRIKKIGDVGEGTSLDSFLLQTTMGQVFMEEAKAGEFSKVFIGDKVLHFKSEDEVRAVHDAVLNAFNAWKVKFPEAESARANKALNQ